MAFIPRKGEGAALVSKGSARVSRKCLLHPCGEASCLLWSWPLVWAEGGEPCSSFVGHRKGRPSPFANRHEQSAHFPAQLCQCWRYSAVDSTLLRDLPGFSPPPACVLRSVKIWFPDGFLAGCQPEGWITVPLSSSQACPQLITRCQHKVSEAGWLLQGTS